MVDWTVLNLLVSDPPRIQLVCLVLHGSGNWRFAKHIQTYYQTYPDISRLQLISSNNIKQYQTYVKPSKCMEIVRASNSEELFFPFRTSRLGQDGTGGQTQEPSLRVRIHWQYWWLDDTGIGAGLDRVSSWDYHIPGRAVTRSKEPKSL